MEDVGGNVGRWALTEELVLEGVDGGKGEVDCLEGVIPDLGDAEAAGEGRCVPGGAAVDGGGLGDAAGEAVPCASGGEAASEVT